MLCDDCGKREAKVHLTKIVNNEKRTLNLCKECAAKKGFHSPLENAPFPLADMLSGWQKNLPQVAPGEPMEDISCDQCGLSFEDFTRIGRFGCGHCYTAFRPRLEKIMRKIHGSSLHRGTGPSSNEAPETRAISVKEEERLQNELKKAIDSEEFERAAEIRDKLKTLREGDSVTS